MLAFLIRRLLYLIPVAFAVVTLVSLIIHAIPGDPVDIMAGPYATQEDRNVLKEKLGLDKPLFVQLTRYYGQVITFDLGRSLLMQKSVSKLLKERLSATIELATLSLAVALIISLPLGTLSALKSGKTLDTVAMAFSLLGVCIPTFCMGPLLVLFFSIKLGWLPVSERSGWESYVLPSLTLGIAMAAILSRMTRTSVLSTIREDFVRTARAKGASEWAVVCKHVMRNSLLPLITIISMQFGALMTGAIITERVFDWPGLGTLMLDAIASRDYPVVQGCVLLFSASYLIVNLAADIASAAADPRIKIE